MNLTISREMQWKNQIFKNNEIDFSKMLNDKMFRNLK